MGRLADRHRHCDPGPEPGKQRAFLDSCVARLLEGIRAAGLADRATVIIVSDHGFKQVKKQIHVTAALEMERGGAGNPIRLVGRILNAGLEPCEGFQVDQLSK